jgi:hypothetical protein
MLSKVNTGAQLIYVALVLLHAAVARPPQLIMEGAALITLATTVVSGLHYLLTFTRRAWLLPAASP